MARPKTSTPPLSHLRVRLPEKLKTDLETIASFQETTLSNILRNQINIYIIRSYSKGSKKVDDDPIFPCEMVKKKLGGNPCSDYIRFQLSVEMKKDLQEITERRGIVISALLRVMVEHYVKNNSLESILLEFQKEQEGAVV